jgi:hypothetical protein
MCLISPSPALAVIRRPARPVLEWPLGALGADSRGHAPDHPRHSREAAVRSASTSAAPPRSCPACTHDRGSPSFGGIKARQNFPDDGKVSSELKHSHTVASRHDRPDATDVLRPEAYVSRSSPPTDRCRTATAARGQSHTRIRPAFACECSIVEVLHPPHPGLNESSQQSNAVGILTRSGPLRQQLTER